MANAKATVVLELRDRFTDPSRRATRELGKLGSQADKIRSAFRFAGEMNQAAEGMARFGAAARRAVELPVKTSMDFEDQMARVGAVSNSTGGQMSLLTEKARELGRDTRFSATQAAEGMQYLAMAGFDATQNLQAIPGTLRLAAAGATDLGRTADIASDILSGFGLQAREMDRVGDVLAKTFTTSNTNLEMLGDSMKYVAPVARSVGAEIEEVAAMAGLLANVGIKASQSGTAMRAMFLRLAAPTGKLRKHMAGLGEDVGELGRGRDALSFLGVSANDANGDMRKMSAVLQDIDAAMTAKGLGTGERAAVLNRIFGAEASAAAAELLVQATNKGEKGLDSYTQSLRDSAGTNERIANRMNATTKGLVAALNSTWEDLNIELGDAMSEDVRGLGTSIRETLLETTKWAQENKTVVKNLGQLALAVAAIGTALGAVTIVGPGAVAVFTGLKLLAMPLALGVKAIGAALNATALGAIAMTAPITAITAPMIALAGAVGYLAYEFGNLIGLDKVGEWIGNKVADLTGITDAANRVGRDMKEGDQQFADGTRLNSEGRVIQKGTEWERHAAGMGIKEWEEKKRQEAAAKAPPAAAPASGEVAVKISLEDNRVGVKTKSKGRGINTSAGPAMAGAGS